MKFTIDSKIINEVYGKISKLLNAKSPVPILSGTLVQANENCILFTASDGTEGVIHRVPVKDNEVTVEEEGSTVLPKEAFEVSRKLKGNNVKFHLVDQTIKIQTGDKTNLEFSVMDANEFPAVNKIKNTNNPIKLKPDEFRTIIKKVAFAVSDSEIRPILQGVNFNISENQAAFYATDSHRLSRYIAHIEGPDINVTIPAKFLESITKSLDENHDVMVFIDTQDIFIVNGNTIYCSRLLQGNYPDVSRLIPSPNFHLIVNKQAFIDVLELLLIISKTRENGSIKLSVNGLFVNLQAIGEVAKGNKEIAFELYDGDESFEIAFNAKFMIDALKAINNDSVKLGFSGDMKPIVVVPNDEDQAKKEVQLILPIRTIS